ncbi:MAG: hypothetical protein ACREQ5_33330, partial [Candidatus Dormibacteria bacterium]
LQHGRNATHTIARVANAITKAVLPQSPHKLNRTRRVREEGTPSGPAWYAKATTSSWSPSCSDTPALTKHGATVCPPKQTANEPSTACSPTTDSGDVKTKWSHDGGKWPHLVWPVGW